jgi:ATP-binding protein involved in chromosome partitioning
MTNYTQAGIIKALQPVIDKDLNKTLGELDSIQKVTFENDKINVYLELVGPVQWIAKDLNEQCAAAINKIAPGVENEIYFYEKPMDNGGRQVLPRVKNIIAVSSGKGGVGKSAVASNIASALHLQGASVGILDGDIYGPSQPTMFGLVGESFEAYQTADGKTVAYPIDSNGIKVASMGFMLNRDEAAIIRGPMLAGYFSLLFEQLDWGELDFLVFDLPPGTGDIQLTMTQKIPLTGAVVVTTPQEISVADVRRSIAMFNKVNVEILGVIENMAYFVPPDLPENKYYIFGQGGGRRIAEENSLPFLGEVPLSIGMREANDSGKPVVLADELAPQSMILREITAKMVSNVRRHNFTKFENPEVEISL